MTEHHVQENEHEQSGRAGRTTRLYLKQLWELIYARLQGELADPVPKQVPKKKLPDVARPPRFLTLLKLVPWLLTALFLLSLALSLEGQHLQLFGNSYPLDNLLRMISVSGLIGFLTNRLAIAMLFRPVKKRPLLGQGLIPAQKDRIAFRLATAVSEDLINPELIKQRIHASNAVSHFREETTHNLRKIVDNPDFRLELKQWTVNYVEAMIADPDFRAEIARKILLEMENSLEERSLEKIAIKAYSYLRSNEIQNIIEKSLSRLPATIEQGLDKADQLIEQLPEKLNTHGETIENIVTNLLYSLVNRLDVQELVEENLRDYNEKKLEDLIRGATNEQLLYIQYLGGILGMVGGLVIWQPLLSLSVLGVAGVVVLLLDHLIANFKESMAL